ncbi:MAG: P1 family peptidase, partial [Terriglobales bacterium]
PGNENVQSINPLVGETNDGFLNDIRSRPIAREDVFHAIQSAKSGPVEEGTVGAGTGTVAFGWKGGIGTASRKLPAVLGGYTVGVLVQTNFGGVLSIAGAPVGKELGKYAFRDQLTGGPGKPSFGLPGAVSQRDDADGSCMIVIATDAPVDARNLKRLAARGIMGLARTGSSGSNGSGDYIIAFSTAKPNTVPVLDNEAMSPLFLAAIEATEEAIYNSLLKATTVTGRGHTIEALPIDKTIEILKEHGMVH